MTDQDCPAPGGDPREERLHILRFQCLQAAAVPGNAGVGIGIVAVTGKMLHHRRHAEAPHCLDAVRHKLPRHRRGLPQRAAIHKRTGVRCNVAHRCQIHIDAQPGKELGLFRLSVVYQFQPALGVQRPGRWKRIGAECLVTADPVDRAALLVHCNQQRDVGNALVTRDFLRHG